MPHARGRTHEGTGIGLALVNELVKFHGGSIRVSQPRRSWHNVHAHDSFGTTHLPPERIQAARTLSVDWRCRRTAFVEEAMRWLSADESASANGTLIEHPSLQATDESNLADLPAVVLADDNADMRNYVRGLLGGRYQVEAVADGTEALAAIRRKRPDLVISDIMMPNVDGFGLLREVRADPKLAGLPVIFFRARR